MGADLGAEWVGTLRDVFRGLVVFQDVWGVERLVESVRLQRGVLLVELTKRLLLLGKGRAGREMFLSGLLQVVLDKVDLTGCVGNSRVRVLDYRYGG